MKTENKWDIILATQHYPDQNIPAVEIKIATAYSKGIAYTILKALELIYNRDNENLFIE